MERVESSFLLLAAVSTLEIHRLYISMEQKQRAATRRRRLLQQASAARRCTPCSVRAAAGLSSAANERKAGPVSNFFESLCCGGCVTHCLNCFDFSSQFVKVCSFQTHTLPCLISDLEFLL